MTLQMTGVHLDYKQRGGWATLSCRMQWQHSRCHWELIYNPGVSTTLFFQYFVQIFLPPNNYTPALKLSISPPFWCLHLSNICRLLTCHPLSHHLAELYRFSTFYLPFKGRPSRPDSFSLLSLRVLQFSAFPCGHVGIQCWSYMGITFCSVPLEVKHLSCAPMSQTLPLTLGYFISEFKLCSQMWQFRDQCGA